MYVRFAVPSDPCRPPSDFHIPTGIIHAAWNLADDRRFAAWEHDLLVDETAWFNANVPVPGKLRLGRAICWFRPEAREAIAHAWQMAKLVEGVGVPVRVYRRTHPGTIVYEDAFQVAALPWRTTFRTCWRADNHRLRNDQGVGARACARPTR